MRWRDGCRHGAGGGAVRLCGRDTCQRAHKRSRDMESAARPELGVYTQYELPWAWARRRLSAHGVLCMPSARSASPRIASILQRLLSPPACVSSRIARLAHTGATRHSTSAGLPGWPSGHLAICRRWSPRTCRRSEKMNHPSTGGPPSASASARAALRNSVQAAFNGSCLLLNPSPGLLVCLCFVPLSTVRVFALL